AQEDAGNRFRGGQPWRGLECGAPQAPDALEYGCEGPSERIGAVRCPMVHQTGGWEHAVGLFAHPYGRQWSAAADVVLELITQRFSLDVVWPLGGNRHQ